MRLTHRDLVRTKSKGDLSKPQSCKRRSQEPNQKKRAWWISEKYLEMIRRTNLTV